jgi:hypothetical protein
MCKHWGLGCINKNSLTSGKPWLENGDLIYINLSFLFSQSDCHSDSDRCAPEVMVPDARVFSSMQNEQKYGFTHGYMTVW